MIGIENVKLDDYKDWKKIEVEILRDKNGNCICIGCREIINNDISAFPVLSITNKIYQLIRYETIELINNLKIIGNINVIYAINSLSEEYKLIKYTEKAENTLIEKVNKYPMERVLKRLKNGELIDAIVIDGKNVCYESKLEQIAISVGEYIYYSDNLEKAILKSSCMSKKVDDYFKLDKYSEMEKIDIEKELERNDIEVFFTIAEAIRKEISVEKICQITKIDKLFVGSIYKIIKLENELSLNYLTFKLVEKAMQVRTV